MIYTVGNFPEFTCINEIEAMYERPRVNVKVEPRSTFTLRGVAVYTYMASILLTRVKITRQSESNVCHTNLRVGSRFLSIILTTVLAGT